MADKKKTGNGTGRPGATKAGPAPTSKPPADAADPAVATAPDVAVHSPLDDRPGTGADDAVLVEHPHLGKIILRGDSADKAFRDAVEKAIGIVPPREANSVATGKQHAILWLGPDEWLVVTPADRQRTTEATLRQALAGQHVSVVDTSDARTTIRLHGVRARDVLMKGTPLDLHPREFGSGRCAQTVIARADVLIHQRDDTPTYDIHVLCSFARYLWDWLVDAAGEFS
ncbi:MAG: hypothetical protein JSU82_10790 [Rhodospirillales bacterium]|nr:MAG: hypothetical protein JSU82_10790 [Rhodospirillales bacterium]